MNIKMQYRFLVGALACLSSVAVCTVFPSHLADGWYPRDPKKLTSLIKSLETQAQTPFDMPTDGNELHSFIDFEQQIRIII